MTAALREMLHDDSWSRTTAASPDSCNAEFDCLEGTGVSFAPLGSPMALPGSRGTGHSVVPRNVECGKTPGTNEAEARLDAYLCRADLGLPKLVGVAGPPPDNTKPHLNLR